MDLLLRLLMLLLLLLSLLLVMDLLLLLVHLLPLPWMSMAAAPNPYDRAPLPENPPPRRLQVRPLLPKQCAPRQPPSAEFRVRQTILRARASWCSCARCGDLRRRRCA